MGELVIDQLLATKLYIPPVRQNRVSRPRLLQRLDEGILLGGSGKGLLRIAARHADIVNIVSDTGRAGTIDPREVAKLTDASFRAKLDFLRTEIRAAERDASKVTLSSTLFITTLADDPEAGRSFAASLGSMFGLEADEVRRMPLALIGTVEECIAELRRREREWGLTHYILSARAAPGFSERFAHEIMPYV